MRTYFPELRTLAKFSCRQNSERKSGQLLWAPTCLVINRQVAAWPTSFATVLSRVLIYLASDRGDIPEEAGECPCIHATSVSLPCVHAHSQDSRTDFWAVTISKMAHGNVSQRVGAWLPKEACPFIWPASVCPLSPWCEGIIGPFKQSWLEAIGGFASFQHSPLCLAESGVIATGNEGVCLGIFITVTDNF